MTVRTTSSPTSPPSAATSPPSGCDLRKLSASGLPPAPGAAGVISSARAAISHAITVANADIAIVNSDVDQAYDLARGMATGSCSGDGPGPTPAPIQPIS